MDVRSRHRDAYPATRPNRSAGGPRFVRFNTDSFMGVTQTSDSKDVTSAFDPTETSNLIGLRWLSVISHSPPDRKVLGACLNSRCSTLSESDSTLGYEQVFSPLEYRSNAAAAAECAGLRAERPCLAIYRRTGAGEPRSQGDHGQLCERARAAAV